MPAIDVFWLNHSM